MSNTKDRSAPGVRVGFVRNPRDSEVAAVDLRDRIISFSFEDDEKKADKATLTLDNSDLSLFDRKELNGGAILQVSWGYPGNMAPSRRLIVKKMKGFTDLSIEGFALSFLMNRTAKTRCFENKTRSEIAREVAKEFGFESGFVFVEDTEEKYDVINQAAETDARFLRRLAQEEGFEFFIDDSGLHWHERQQGVSPSQVFTWYKEPAKSDILSISIESDLSRRVGVVKVKGRDPKTKQNVEAEAHNGNLERDTLGHVIEVSRVYNPELEDIQEIGVVDYEDPMLGQSIQQVPVYEQDLVNEESVFLERNAVALELAMDQAAERAKKAAGKRFKKAERATIKLNMTVIGDPSLRAKSVVEIEGIPQSMSGKYFVHSVKHNISSSGYTCDL
ncbi:MAG: phage late control D family protein, partial [Deltaproteobacteria bacterium]|nr:phage late control D family protein [Deltaproteobacteria bacterium]